MTPLEKAGIAEGSAEIYSDTVVFRFKGDVFEVPTIALKDVDGFYNGYFYVAKVRKLKSWQKHQRRDDVEKQDGKRRKN